MSRKMSLTKLAKGIDGTMKLPQLPKIAEKNSNAKKPTTKSSNPTGAINSA